MDFELSLLENSYDFIEESLSYYKDLGYNETHDPDRDSIIEKKKWKTTYILLVQAIELLIKEKLYRINPQMIYENIDCYNKGNSKVIGYSQSIDRITSLKPDLIDDKNIQFLKTCGNIRNQCIHNTVKMNSVDIKIKYCKLFELYLKLHSKFFRKKYKNNKYKYQIKNIVDNAKDLIVCRGQEYTRKELKKFNKELSDAQLYCYGISKNIAYERVKYGHEKKVLKKFYDIDMYSSNYKYCGDCSATYDEYHAIGCDCEICPKCGNQLISCECFDSLYTITDINILKEKNEINTIINLDND